MDAIIFLAPISCFDQVLAEDNTVNRLVRFLFKFFSCLNSGIDELYCASLVLIDRLFFPVHVGFGDAIFFALIGNLFSTPHHVQSFVTTPRQLLLLFPSFCPFILSVYSWRAMDDRYLSFFAAIFDWCAWVSYYQTGSLYRRIRFFCGDRSLRVICSPGRTWSYS